MILKTYNTIPIKLNDIFDMTNPDERGGGRVLLEGAVGSGIALFPLIGGGVITTYSILTSDSKIGIFITLYGLALSILGIHEGKEKDTKRGIIITAVGLGFLATTNDSLAKTALLASGIGMTTLGIGLGLIAAIKVLTATVQILTGKIHPKTIR
jgi:hypothetical protein